MAGIIDGRISDAVTVAQRLNDSDSAQAAAAAYKALAVHAQMSNAKGVTTLAADALNAATDLAQASQNGSNANELVTKVFRLQVPDTSLRLACAEHGHSIFASASASTTTR